MKRSLGLIALAISCLALPVIGLVLFIVFVSMPRKEEKKDE